MSSSIRQQIPQEMFRNGRPIDQEFAKDEDLYCRFLSIENGHPAPTDIRIPQSVNRGKYSEPQWVLLPNWPDWGYGSVKVNRIPDEIRRGDNVFIELKPRHDPLEENFSHSEINSYENGENCDRKLNNNKKFRLKARTELSRRIEILRLPIKTLP